MCKFKAINQIKEELSNYGYEIDKTTLNEGILTVSYYNLSGTNKLYIPYRYMTPERLHNKIVSEVM